MFYFIRVSLKWLPLYPTSELIVVAQYRLFTAHSFIFESRYYEKNITPVIAQISLLFYLIRFTSLLL